MRCNLVAIRHFETDGEIAGRGHGIAFQHSQLRSGGQEGRSGPELNLIGCEGVLRK